MLRHFLSDLETLVNIDSSTDNIAGIRKIAEILQFKYKELGFSAKLIDLHPKAGPALFVTNRPHAKRLDVLFSACTDTVFPDMTAFNDPMTIEGNRVKGPGALDCKGGSLAILYTLANTPLSVLDKLAIAVCYLPDGEAGFFASHRWFQDIASRASSALVFGPAKDNGEMICARKSAGTFKIEFHGKSTHADIYPGSGSDALLAMVKFIAKVKEHEDQDKGITINFGCAQAGLIPNVVAENASAQCRVFAWSNKEYYDTKELLLHCAKQTWVEGVTQTVTEINHISAMPFSEASKELAKKIEKAAWQEGFDIRWGRSAAISDGNYIAAMGVPVLDGFGPQGSNLYSKNEYLEINSIEKKVKIVIRFLEDLASNK